MALLERKSFGKGWVPDADAVNGPVDGLLRADNLILDELGRVSVRPGSTLLGTVADDISALYTATLNGTKIRFGSGASTIYKTGGVPLVTGVSGAGDVAFGSHRGQILMARGGTKKKFDGSAVRNWGIAMTGAVVTSVPLAPDTKMLLSGDSTESPAVVFDEDDGIGPGFAVGQDGTANGAIVINPSGAHRATMTKTWATDQDFSVYDGATDAGDDDILELYIYVLDPQQLLAIDILIDINGDSTNAFQDDYFFGSFQASGAVAPIPQTAIPASHVPGRRIPHTGVPVTGAAVSRIRTDMPVLNAGWSKLQMRRSQLLRVGNTGLKGWDTVRAIRIMATTNGDSGLEFDSVRMVSSRLLGPYQWAYVYAYNSGSYVGLSAPSPFSDPISVGSQGSTVTIPADPGRDGQVNEIWLFRFGGPLDQFYRVNVSTGVGAGAVVVVDTLSDADTLEVNLPMELDNDVPPDGIVGIAGPYYDRVFALTPTQLAPSRQLNPDSFSAGQVVNVAGADETAYWVKQSLGGLYIGTSKDIYRLEGTGTELPDGTVDFTFAPLNIDHPPIGDGVAQDGHRLIYMAADGWRMVAGAGSTLLVEATSLLYKGYTRHGVSPINVLTGRFRAAIARGQLVVLAPEGASTTSTPVVYRHAPVVSAWYRHTYPTQLRTVYTEPDGTLLASDTTGNVWQLDAGPTDGGTLIPITLWTTIDDADQALTRKDPWDFRVRVNTGGVPVAFAFHTDGATTPTLTVTATQSREGVTLADISALGVWRQIQLRVTAAVSVFGLYDYGIGYRARPPIAAFVESKPVVPSLQRRRFGGLQIILDTIGGDALVTPILDGVAQPAFTLNTTDAVARTLTFQTLVGRDLWAKVTKADGFELYQVDPLITETLPVVFQGLTPRMPAGSSGSKALSGLQLRLCTLGLTRTITPLLDGVPQAVYSVTSGLDDPTDFTLDFPVAIAGTEISFRVDGDIELYAWSPIVTFRKPLGVKVYDTGPILVGERDLIWIRQIRVKVNAGADLSIVPYLDSVPYPAVIGHVQSGVDTIVPVDVGRACVGRVVRLVITSGSPFFPYYVEVVRRASGLGTEKPHPRYPLTLQTGATV